MLQMSDPRSYQQQVLGDEAIVQVGRVFRARAICICGNSLNQNEAILGI
jgi:hypothetical protein